MRVMNAMFSKVNGGLEQVFLNYTPTLKNQGNQVISVIHPKAEIKEFCAKDNLFLIHNFNQYDPVAVIKLRQLIRSQDPQCIITHSYRASYLFKKTRTKVPKVAVCHVRSHYEFGSNAIIALTEHMRNEIIAAGQPKDTVYTVPNMITLPEDLHFKTPKEFEIPVIGACARMVHIKGLDVFIEALAELKRRKIPFKAQIAGDGKEREHLVQLIRYHRLDHHVLLPGWVSDMKSFYQNLDIFCLPSREETFGMVVLESMLHSLPMVLTDLSGPREISGHSDSAIFVPPNDPIQMADGLERIIYDKTLSNELAFNAFNRVHDFSCQKIGPILQETLHNICKKQRT